MKKMGSIESLIKSRTNVIEIYMVAIAIGISINILAGLLISSKIMGSIPKAIVAIIILTISSGYIIFKMPFGKFRDYKISGMLVFSLKPLRLISIFRYQFSYALEQYFTAIFEENKAIKKMWDKEKSGFGPGPNSEKNKSTKLIKEAIEYFFLNSLSLHLSAAFENNDDIEKNKIITVERNSIPEVLLENRFLETFSRPMEDREVFASDHDSLDPDSGKIVMSMGKGGVLFERFQLILPKGSIVRRLKSDTIEIKTKRFTLQCESIFTGYSDNAPYYFEEIYLKKKMAETHALKAGVKVRVKLHIWSIFTVSGWEYYRWLDSFLNSLEKKISKKKFIKKIGWNIMLTNHEIEHRP